MTEKYNDATFNRPEGERVIDAESVFIDLPAFIQQIKHENAWRDSDRNGITVYKTPSMRIVLGGLHKGTILSTHIAEGVMSIQVIEGLAEVVTDVLTATLAPMQMMTIHKDSNYKVTAKEETMYLLTITGVSSPLDSEHIKQ